MLRGAGFSQAVNLDGGMLAWRSSEKVAGQGH
jgi:rhodanese-related sulfurtransferase